MRIKKLMTVAVAATAMVAMTACTGGGGTSTTGSATSAEGDKVAGEITFQTWSLKNDRFTPYFENLIKEFEKKYPDVKVKWIDQPGDGYEDKILQQASSGELPDVINLPPEFAYKLAQVNKLLDLKKADPAELDKYVTGATNAYQYPNIEGTFAYPWYLGTDLNWYNKELLKEGGWDPAKLPTSNEELFEMAATIAKNTDGKIKTISEVPRTGTLSAAGVEIYKDGKFVFNTDKAVKIVEMYQKAYKEGAMVPEALNADYLGNSMLYKQGKVAWTTASAGLASELKKDAPTMLDKSLVTSRFGHAPLFIQGISVKADSKAPAAALKFAQFATNNDNQVEFLKLAQGFFPGTKAGNENPASFTDVVELPLQKEATKKAAEVIENARPEYPIQFTYEMDTYLKQQLALAVQGKISAKEALDKSVEHANSLLTK
ncbi:extracellular solute-binding protein [Actinomycetaceae bacterium TAE3-ERU4]|nr:extracellular solute-binding protein [Actinomycetaceae bacterium TAE3-ERU4]